MANDISGFGLQVQLRASVTFPSGVTLTQFADDADPLDMQAIQIADKAMGLNGDLITWGKATALPMVLNVIPGSEDDRNLAVLFNANRVGKGKTPSRDVITATVMYPDGKQRTLSAGKMTDGMVGNSVASSGRMKTKAYTFAFENDSGT
jgi:hypothetical protein